MAAGNEAYIGCSETRADVARESAAAGLLALLDRDEPVGDALPPLAHWLLFHSQARQSELGTDGHEKRGGFLPPIALPRRMFAGARIVFHAAIPLGARLERRTTIASIEEKSGRSGQMVFVGLRHDIFAGGIPALTEEQDIVYREAPKADMAASLPERDARESELTCAVHPDSRLLFRYSALSFNAHRIHYDRDYAREAEGYPGLVVHGPLIATLLLDHFRRTRAGANIARFSFRALRPLFDTAPFELCLAHKPAGADLWARTADGALAMSAEIHTP